MAAMRARLRSLWAAANFGSLWRATIRALSAARLKAVAASRRAANSGFALSEAISRLLKKRAEDSLVFIVLA
jgi:hypothetical protein